MIERVRGLLVIAEHPPGQTLDGPAFYQQIIGVCVWGYVDGPDLCGVLRLVDDRAAEILTKGTYDTSPCAVFSPRENILLKVGADELLLEGVPSFLDHVALVDTSAGNAGVWSKNGAAPRGVEITEKESANA